MKLSSPEYLHSMNETALTFIGYIIWMVLLLMTLIGLRAKAVLQGKKASNDFLPDGTDLSPFVARLTRVHANCYEFFPLFGGILLFTMIMGTTQITNGLAYYFLTARILQGVLHLISTNEKAVLLRLVFFVAQMAIVIIWMAEIIRINLL
ncbi:MAG: MAPEG family protein [Proteobacteria bacterium]|nr:MAPEG family protein [Pseudomonadota bacterium]